MITFLQFVNKIRLAIKMVIKAKEFSDLKKMNHE